MIDVQMAIHDEQHLVEAHARAPQRLAQWAADRSVVPVDVGVRPHAGVEEEEPASRADDDVAQERLDAC